MKRGFLIYKCRRCGKLNKNTYVPDGVIALSSIINKIEPRLWDGAFVGQTSVCFCDDGNLGISDLIGFEKDE